MGVISIVLFVSGCIPSITPKNASKTVPENFKSSQDSTANADKTQDTTANIGKLEWRKYFTDPNLTTLIDTALQGNQELNIILQEIKISQNEIRSRKGAYLPFVNGVLGAGVERSGQYTRNGAIDESLDIKDGKRIPKALGDFMIGANVSWELDIWRKLRNSKKAAVYKFLATTEGKNFMVTNLVAEIANTYYELMALDNHLSILQQNIEIQNNALKTVRLQKQAAQVTELAVRRFEALVFNTQSRQFEIQQQIIEIQNRLNFLIGRYPKTIVRNSQNFSNLAIDSLVQAGIPSQLLQNRRDIKEAELNLEASKLDVRAAKANFYPLVTITGGAGYNAFNPQFLFNTPESIALGLVGGAVTPLINRNAIKATYLNASAKQIQAAYHYERTILNAYIEVSNQLAKIDNLKKSYDLKNLQVQALTQSVDISSGLFMSARANYVEVLLTQRDAVESKMELIETKKQQLNATVDVYRALGGGW